MGVIICVECRKSRLYYSRIRLSGRQEQLLAIAISEYDYTCGGPIAHPSVALLKSVFAREKLTCGYPVETQWWCQHWYRIEKKYKTVLPICEASRGSGEVAIVQRPYVKNAKKINLTCAVLRLKLFNLVTFVPLYYQNHTIWNDILNFWTGPMLKSFSFRPSWYIVYRSCIC